MKLWALVGFFMLTVTPVAHAAENALPCEATESRVVNQRVSPPPPIAETPPPAAAPVAVAPQRDPAAAQTVARIEQPQRRRGGSRKRIPDAVLIGPRGAL